MTVRNDVIARFYKRLKEDNPKRNSKKLIETHFETIQEMLASGSNILFIWEF